MRQKYCQLSPDGVREWSNYEQSLTQAKEKCQSVIGKALESHFGMSALHPGSFPSHWKMPGGLAKHNYPKTDKERMMSSKDVADTKVLKTPKCMQEDCLYEFAAHYTNLAKSHKCNICYCIRSKRLAVRYDKEIHANVTPDKIWMQGDVQMTHILVCNCRFDFGTPRRYDPSGEK